MPQLGGGLRVAFEYQTGINYQPASHQGYRKFLFAKMTKTFTSTSGLIPSTPVAWPTDRHITIPTGRVVRTYACDPLQKTALQSAQLHGHEAAVSAVVSLPGMKLATAANDSTLRIWDVSTGQVLRTMDLAHPVLDMVALSSEQLLCLTESALLLVKLKSKRASGRKQIISKMLLNMLYKPMHVAASKDGSIVAVSDWKKIHLFNLKNHSALTTIKCKDHVTAIAISSDGQMLAAGESGGAIYLFSRPAELITPKRRILSYADVGPSKLHWHANAVRALAFTHENTTLLSAGLEAVLVSWRLTPTNFGHRSFLPRLGAPIIAISVSPDESTYALSHADNAVRLIDQAATRVTTTIRAICAHHRDFCHRAPQASLRSEVVMGYSEKLFMTSDPVHPGKAWLGGSSGSLQSFDLIRGTHVNDLHVIPRNEVFEDKNRKNRGERPPSASVSMAAVHALGTILASVEYRPLQTDDCQRYGTEKGVSVLKFWRRRRHDEEYELEATITRPHGTDASISSLCFHPFLPVLATAGSNGKVRFWRSTCIDIRGSMKVSWRNEVEGEYKGVPCSSVCFSNDGSLLGAAFRNVLAIWIVEDLHQSAEDQMEKMTEEMSSFVSPLAGPTIELTLCQTLIHPPENEEICSVSFVFDKVPLFIATTKFGIYVWDPVAQSILWSTRTRNSPRCLAVDKSSGRFAVPVWTPSVAAGMEDNSGDDVIMENAIESESNDPNAGHREESANEEKMDLSAETNPDSKKGHLDKTRKNSNNMETDDGKDSHADTASAVPKRHKHFVEMDPAIAVFQASSPIPVSVSRLSPGTSVSALSFVGANALIGSEQSALVCIDSNMEVCVYSKSSDGEASAVASEASTVLSLEPDNKSNLKKLLWEDSGENNASKSVEATQPQDFATEAFMPSLVTSALKEYFPGEVHTQAPVEAKCLDFALSLLSGMENSQHKESSAIGIEGEDVEEKSSGAKTGQVHGQSSSVQVSAMGSMRAFCGSLIRIEHPTKDKKRKG